MWQAPFHYVLSHTASKGPGIMGWGYILLNEANSHLPKAHLSTYKRKVTSRIALKVYVKTRRSWKRWRQEKRIRVGWCWLAWWCFLESPWSWDYEADQGRKKNGKTNKQANRHESVKEGGQVGKGLTSFKTSRGTPNLLLETVSVWCQWNS